MATDYDYFIVGRSTDSDRHPMRDIIDSEWEDLPSKPAVLDIEYTLFNLRLEDEYIVYIGDFRLLYDYGTFISFSRVSSTKQLKNSKAYGYKSAKPVNFRMDSVPGIVNFYFPYEQGKCWWRATRGTNADQQCTGDIDKINGQGFFCEQCMGKQLTKKILEAIATSQGGATAVWNMYESYCQLLGPSTGDRAIPTGTITSMGTTSRLKDGKAHGYKDAVRYVKDGKLMVHQEHGDCAECQDYQTECPHHIYDVSRNCDYHIYFPDGQEVEDCEGCERCKSGDYDVWFSKEQDVKL